MNRQMKDLMAQAQKMQASLTKMQDELALARIEGGSGPVRAVVNGQGELQDLKISPGALEGSDASLLEDLVMAAVRDAVAKSREYSASRMETLGLPRMGGLM
ncbi:MAG TPA: YbaB/EbfC family nucleoid-associated protein [Candidatus Fermentibacter sp.]|nr:YbaB/EbfC family nucleoid-associated protein [Candidatus Fermentibacter sp.]